MSSTWSKSSRHVRGYGAEWDRLRLLVLKRDKHLCQHCWRAGRPTPATDVDHIVSKARGGTDETSNLQSLCRECHDAKSKRDRGHRVRPLIGLDGFPVEE
jgi:5-methylcytosine-specific restriction protein A